MKKILSVLLSIVMLALVLAVPVSAAEAELVLAENGETEYVIVIGENASPADENAANILKDYLGRITGADFPIVKDSAPEQAKEIAVGVTARNTTVDCSTMDADGVRIFTEGEKLFLTGGKDRGGIYSVHTFLEEWLGCRWFTYDLIVVPESDVTAIPADIDYSYEPAFKLRQTFWSFSAGHTEYSAAHKLHGVMSGMGPQYGGPREEMCINAVHTLQYMIPASLYAEHPEYFGIDENGNRSIYRQPCLSNPEVLQLAIDFVKNYCSQYNIICSVSQNDGMAFCLCDECTSFNAAHGNTDAASMINFVNKVAVAVREEIPGARVETLAYQATETPPTGIVPEKNVFIRLCPINSCVLHDMDDPCCPDNAAFHKNLTGWSEITENIYIWNYSTNFQYFYAPFPNITGLQARYQYFRDMGIDGVFDNGCGEVMPSGEFHDLRVYLLLKLLWNPDIDVEQHMKEFCDAYYGEAADDVIEFLYTFEETVGGFKVMPFGNCHFSCNDGGESMTNNTSMTASEVKKLDDIMESAKSKNLTPEQAHRLEGLSISWRFIKNATWSGEFSWLSYKSNPVEESERLFNDMNAYGIKFLNEGQSIHFDKGTPNFTVLPTFWYHAEADLPMMVNLLSKVGPVINNITRFLGSAIMTFAGLFN